VDREGDGVKERRAKDMKEKLSPIVNRQDDRKEAIEPKVKVFNIGFLLYSCLFGWFL
jgi:hypothetical protein